MTQLQMAKSPVPNVNPVPDSQSLFSLSHPPSSAGAKIQAAILLMSRHGKDWAVIMPAIILWLISPPWPSVTNPTPEGDLSVQ